MNDGRHEWTSPIIARLRELHGNGMPFTQIAFTLNKEFDTALTRNAVIGKGRRLQLKLRATPWATRKAKSERPKRKRRGPLRPIAPAPPLAPPDPAPPGALTMAQLTACTCRWPEGLNPPYTYCGEPTWRETPFCREHCIRAYDAPRLRWV